MMNVRKCALYLYALFLLLCNGSVFWGIRYGSVICAIVFVISLFLSLTRGKIRKSLFQNFGILTVLLLISNVININNGVNWVSVVQFIYQLASIMLLQSFLDMKKVHKAIVQCMAIICIVSLVTFFLRILGSPLFNSFIRIEMIHGSSYKYIYTFWHTFGWNVDFNRNAGPYWEPGMFACYIAISMFIVLFETGIVRNNISKYCFLTLYIITLLSTLSTTAYLVLILFTLYFWYLMPKETKKQAIIKILAIFASVICMILLFKTEVVQNKIFTENSSMIRRTANVTNGIKLILEDPVFGLGFRSDKSRELEIIYKAGNAANGLIQGIYRMGALVFSVLIIYYKRGIGFIMSTRASIFGTILLLFLFFCEPIQIFLICLSFAFIPQNGFGEEEEECNE